MAKTHTVLQQVLDGLSVDDFRLSPKLEQARESWVRLPVGELCFFAISVTTTNMKFYIRVRY